jgi:hypothetical protein
MILSLSIDTETVECAQQIARKRGTSLDQLVEAYLQDLILRERDGSQAWEPDPNDLYYRQD